MKSASLRQTGVSFFLGAGASMDLGFPSGADLKARISQDLRQPEASELGRLVLQAFDDRSEAIRAFGRDLGVSQESSIDAFLNQHREHLDVGRVAVWLCILEAERSARGKDITRFWLYRFLERLFEGVTRPHQLDRYYPRQLDFEFLHGLTIHTLNYDRLAEHTLVTWMKNRFPDLDFVAGNYVSQLNPGGVVQHPHGSLGPVLGDDALKFGADCPDNPRRVHELASRLGFWFEPENSPDAYSRTNRVRDLRGVHVVVGFGYHSQISQRFRPPEGSDAKLHRVIATSRDDCRKRADEWLRSVYGHGKITLSHLVGASTCADAVDALFEDESHDTGTASR